MMTCAGPPVITCDQCGKFVSVLANGLCGKCSSLGPNAPTTTNPAGGSQSAVAHTFTDGFPAAATLEVARIVYAGAAKYGPDNWRKIPCRDHINHAMIHLFAFLLGDASDEHLEHAACRVMFALEMAMTEFKSK